MKRILTVVLSLLILLTLCTPAFAEDARYKPISEISDQELTNCALNFAYIYDSTLELTVDNIIPIYDTDNVLIGYSLSYYKDGEPYGYLMLDFRFDDPISEFVIDKDVCSIYCQLIDETAQINTTGAVQKKLTKLSALNYAISFYFCGQNTYFATNGEKYTTAEIKRFETDAEPLRISNSDHYIYDSWNQLFIERGNVIGSGTTHFLKKFDRNKSILSSSDIKRETGKFACVVVAMTEIANQEDILLNGSIKDTFLKLSDTMNTTYGKPGEDGIQYGYNYTDEIESGFIEYCEFVGKKCNSSSKFIPSFKDLANIIDDKNHNYSACLTIIINIPDSEAEEGYRTSSHTVNVLGYLIADYNHFISNYLAIATGWTETSPRYINYSSCDFVHSYAFWFEVT